MQTTTRLSSLSSSARRGLVWLLLLAPLALAVAQPAAARTHRTVDPIDTPTKGALYRDGSTERYLVGGTWLYQADRANTGTARGLWRGNTPVDGWSPVTVPNAFNAGDFSSAGFSGYVAWYRKDFVLPSRGLPGPASKLFWVIRFESVNFWAKVWLNGRLIGSHSGAYLPFEFDLGGLHAGVNHLVIRVDNRRTQDSISPNGMYVSGGPQGAWWNFGGLLREVYLRPVLSVDMPQVVVRPILPCPTCDATIQELVTLRNVTNRTQVVHLRGVYGTRRLDFGTYTIRARAKVVAQDAVLIHRPHLWSIDRPTLYRASLTLSNAAGVRLGGYVTYSGIRSIKVSGGVVLLNGRRLNLRGVGMHESDVIEGAALDSAHIARIIGWVRQLHATLIRAHYPLNPQLEELADRDGILLWNEIPVYQIPSVQLANPGYLKVAHQMLEDNIAANQNHPSILLWSLGNELPTPAGSSEAAYLRGAAALARSLDPTRPIGLATSSYPGAGCQSAYAPLDIVGFNDYFGWYSVNGGLTDDRDGLGPFLDTFRACYPAKGLFITEFGFEANRSGPVDERGTYAFQADAAAYHLGVFAQKPWLSGAIYWALQDFVLGPGWSGGNPLPDPPNFRKGLIDLQGVFKPAAAVVQSIYAATRQIGPPPT
jgi:glycosyl hydrolase family 2